MTPHQLEIARRLWGWEPHGENQRNWLLAEAKVKTAPCGRRWGKSEAEGIDGAMYALSRKGSRQFVIAPTDDQTKIIVGMISQRLHAAGLKSEIREISSPFASIALLDASHHRDCTYIAGRTAGGKGIRGHYANRLIIDERQDVPDDQMEEVILPLLADTNGDLVQIGTPKGKGRFYRDFMRGQAGEEGYFSIQLPTYDNTYISSEYIEKQRQTLPDRVFRQEYLAEFLEESGGVFRGVDQCIFRDDNYEPKGPFSMGVDLARKEDFTVITVLDANNRQVYFDRFNEVAWKRQIELIRTVYEKFPGCKVTMDATGIGDPLVEQLEGQKVTVNPYILTNSSKESLINNLAIEIENRRIFLRPHPQQIAELNEYAYEVTPSRNIRMNAPQGQHDDTVIALALAAWGNKKVMWHDNLSNVVML